jgi:DNA-directed RNA polymerase subunit K/omega
MMIQRPPNVGRFQFVVLAARRAEQLLRGCQPKTEGTHKATVAAQLEVSQGTVVQVSAESDAAREASVTDVLVPREPAKAQAE